MIKVDAKLFTREDMRRQVVAAVEAGGEGADDFRMDDLMDALIDEWGVIGIDVIDANHFWGVVAMHER